MAMFGDHVQELVRRECAGFAAKSRIFQDRDSKG
jgi:hypothetical protein